MKLGLSTGEIILVVIASLLLIAAMVYSQLQMTTSLVHSRKFQQMLLILFLCGALCQLLLSASRLEPFLILVTPLSFFTAFLVHHLAWHRVTEAAHIAIFLLVLCIQFLLS